MNIVSIYYNKMFLFVSNILYHNNTYNVQKEEASKVRRKT